MADGFKYPGETEPWAKVRRLVFAFLIAGTPCLLLFAIPIELRNNLISFILTIQQKNGQISPIDEKNVNIIILLSIFVPLFGLLIVKPNITKILDFHLFPFFDTSSSSVFESIKRVTGELVWNGPVGKDQEDAWKTLEEWATHEVGHGKFKFGWMLKGKVELKKDDEEYWFKQFDCAFLLGPNGVGKTQLAKELGRKLAKRAHFGDSYPQQNTFETNFTQFKCWFLRIWPSTETYSKKQDAMVWDAATVHVVGEQIEDIKSWRPSKPTFLILDDPSFEMASKLIDTLHGIKKHFWYPVRLLVLDQFIPFKLQINNSDNQYYWSDNYWSDKSERDNPDGHLVVAQIGSIEWDTNLLTKAYSRGIWYQKKKQSIGHLRSLKHPDDLQKLCHALDSNPYLLSLALHWLYDNQQAMVADLLNTTNATEDSKIQKLLAKRVRHLFDTHHAAVKDSPIDLNPNEIICLAAISGRYQFDTEIYESDLKKLFPGYHNQGITAPGPWQFCELYVQRYFEEALKHNEHKLDALITQAFTKNPDGVMRRLLQKGWLATKIQTLIEQQAFENEDLQLELVRLQINRALWIEAYDIDKAIVAINTYLEKHQTAENTEKLWQILQDCNNQPFVNTQNYPNYLPRNTLALVLNTHLLKQRPVDNDFAKNAENLLAPLPRWLSATNYNLVYVPDELLTPFKTAVQHWLAQFIATLSLIADNHARTSLAEFIRLSLLRLVDDLGDSVTAPLLALNLDDPQAEIRQQDAAYICELFLWRGTFSNLSNREFIKDQI